MSPSEVRSRLHIVVALAHLLETVENGAARATAEGYRLLVQRLHAALSEDFPADALLAVLNRYQATSLVYENMHYEHSGLFRAPLEHSVSSELMAKQVLLRAARASRKA
jgi:hypothetical protein